MKRTIILTTILLTLATAFPVLAQQAHHPGTDQGTAQMDTQALDSSMAKMKEMRQKMVTTKDPATQQKMMGEHMQQMKKMMAGMSMMSQGNMMGQGNMKGQKNMKGQGNMNGQKNMMGQGNMNGQGNMKGQNNMMNQGNMKGQGNMMGQGMAGCKMKSGGMQWMQMTEKKMQVMQEVIDGILAQQELQMKNAK